MPFLTINNVTVSVDAKSGDRKWKEIGDRDRAFDGTLRSTRQALKRSWEFVSNPLPLAEADALVALVQGRGHAWSFDVDLYSSKGLAKKTQTGTVNPAIAGGKFGNKVQLTVGPPAGQVSWGVGLTGDYTLTVWRNEASVWKHYVIRKTGVTVNKWKDGVQDDLLATGWLTVNGSGDVVLGDGSNADDFDDLVALPFSIPSSWVSALFSSTRAFPSLPKLEAGGVSMSSPTTPISVHGIVDKESPEPHVSGGAWQDGAKRIEFSLEET